MPKLNATMTLASDIGEYNTEENEYNFQSQEGPELDSHFEEV